MNEIDIERLLAVMQAEVCDMRVPYFRNGVPAGYPTAPGDYDGDYEMVPKALLKVCDFIVSVTGDSMRDADIHDGDDVIVKRCGDYDDGDIVVACLDGETTLEADTDYTVGDWSGELINADHPIIRMLF